MTILINGEFTILGWVQSAVIAFAMTNTIICMIAFNSYGRKTFFMTIKTEKLFVFLPTERPMSRSDE